MAKIPHFLDFKIHYNKNFDAIRKKETNFQKISNENDIFYQAENIEINDDLFIFTGPNGSGKTKFLDYLKKKFSVSYDGLYFSSIITNFSDKNYDSVDLDETVCYLKKKQEKLNSLISCITEAKTPDNDHDLDLYESLKRIYDESNEILKIDLKILGLLKQYWFENPPGLFFDFKPPFDMFKSTFKIFQKLYNMVLRYFQEIDADDLDNIKNFLKNKNEQVDSLDNKELVKIYFKIKFPPPLDIINNGFKKLNFRMHHQDSTFILQKKIRERYIEISEPSSGEIFLLNFIMFKNFIAKFFRITQLFIDEPDRHLEPKYIEFYFDIVRTLIEEKNIQVFMTTHRPDSISLAPSESIWLIEMDAEEKKILKKCHKLQALFKLTYNLRTIINFKIKVFVEAHADYDFYQLFYRILQKYSNDVRDYNKQIGKVDDKFEWLFKNFKFKNNRILSRRYQLEFCSSSKKPSGDEGGLKELISHFKREISSFDYISKNDRSFLLNDNYNFSFSEFMKPFALRDYDMGPDSKDEIKINKLLDEMEKDYHGSKDRVHTLSEHRYAIDNFIFDPVLIFSSFKNKNIFNKYFGQEDNEYFDMINNQTVYDDLLKDFFRKIIKELIKCEKLFEEQKKFEKLPQELKKLEKLNKKIKERKEKVLRYYLENRKNGLIKFKDEIIENFKFDSSQEELSKILKTWIDHLKNYKKQEQPFFNIDFDFKQNEFVLIKVFNLIDNSINSLDDLVDILLKETVDQFYITNIQNEPIKINYPRVLLKIKGHIIEDVYYCLFKINARDILKEINLNFMDHRIWLSTDLAETFLELNKKVIQQVRDEIKQDFISVPKLYCKSLDEVNEWIRKVEEQKNKLNISDDKIINQVVPYLKDKALNIYNQIDINGNKWTELKDALKKLM